jgi:hypothetical protein
MLVVVLLSIRSDISVTIVVSNPRNQYSRQEVLAKCSSSSSQMLEILGHRSNGRLLVAS